MTQREIDQILLDEVSDYLALTDEQLAGYGLSRGTLEFQKAWLMEKLS